MAFDGNLTYHVFKDFGIAFDEKGSTVGSMRKVQWVKEGDEPDESKAKIELRKIYTSGETEKVGKGYTFSTPEGPSELALGLIEAGFGETKNILRTLRTRDDFAEAVNTINDDDDANSDGDELFDMRSLLMNVDTDEEE